jgi:hypothetical protein
MRSLIIVLCAAFVVGCATTPKEAPIDPKTGKPVWTSVYDPTGTMMSTPPNTLGNRIAFEQARAWHTIKRWLSLDR